MTRQPYETLKWRIHNIPKSVDLLEEFPEFKKHIEPFKINEGLRSDSQQNEILRYLIYLYDKGSDLLKEEPDLSKRKWKARELSGMSSNHSVDKLESMGFYFLTRVTNERKFREWCLMQQELEEKQAARWGRIDESETKDPKQFMEAHAKKGELMKQSMELHKALDAIEQELFSDNVDVKIKSEELLTTPEKIASAYAGSLERY